MTPVTRKRRQMKRPTAQHGDARMERDIIVAVVFIFIITLYWKRDSAKRDSAQRDSAKWDSAKRDSAKQDSAKRDSAKRDSANQDSAKRDSAKRDSAKRDRTDHIPMVYYIVRTTKAEIQLPLKRLPHSSISLLILAIA